jgi:lysine biosynthesis protein LysW
MVTCEHCGTEREVIVTGPLILALAPEESNDGGE